MKKAYSLRVDEDIVPFEAISINEDGSPTNERNAEKMFAYENSPTIVNLSGMTEIPNSGDIYDPSLDGFPFVRQSPESSDNFEDHGKFAIVVDSLVKFIIAFDLSTEPGSKMNAVFSSNPEFLEPEIVE
jgi:hypothetical protein